MHKNKKPPSENILFFPLPPGPFILVFYKSPRLSISWNFACIAHNVIICGCYQPFSQYCGCYSTRSTRAKYALIIQPESMISMLKNLVSIRGNNSRSKPEIQYCYDRVDQRNFNQNYKEKPQFWLLLQYQKYFNQNYTEKLQFWSLLHTLRFFFKFVSRANNLNIYRPTESPRKQKNVALEKFLE